MRIRKRMRARRDPAALHRELTALRIELAALRAELTATRAPAAANVASRYAEWRTGPLVRLGKALARRAATTPLGEPPVRWRGAAMRTLSGILLDPALDADIRHHRVGDALTALLGDPGWRNDATLIRTLIETRDGARHLVEAVPPGDWIWPAAENTPIDPARHEILPGSVGDRVALVVAPALHTLPALVIAG